MKPVGRLLLVVFGIVAVVGLGLAQQPTMTLPEAGLRLAMRDAWDANARWTRSYIVSSLAGLPDVKRVSSRLLESADDVADALKSYYQDPVVMPLATLLKRNVLLTVALVAAVRGGDSLATSAAYGNWSAGSDSLVRFLAGTNPNWPGSKLGALLQRYQDQTWRQILARTRQDWMADVAACDQASIEARAVADALSSGIVRQFPDKLK
jgi:hypothetical protein